MTWDVRYKKFIELLMYSSTMIIIYIKQLAKKRNHQTI